MIKNLLVILYIFPLFTISALNNDSTNFQSSDTFGVTPHSVIENYIEAIGGRERIAEIIDQTIVLKSTTPNIDLAIKIIRKAPNKLFVELDYSVGKQITIFNGEKGKVESIGQFKNVLGMELEQLKYQAQLNPFLRYFTDEFSLEFKGVEKVNDEDSYKIVITSTNNKKITQFYSVNSRLKLREVNELTTTQ